jgi:DedD protein
MDSAMRDLDQLRERGDETTGRKAGLFAMAAVLSVSAVFAMGLAVGRGNGTSADDQKDPLADLALTPAKAEGRDAPLQDVEVKPEALSFPSTLGGRDDPLVEATVRAAEAEHAALAGRPLPADAMDLPPPAPVADLPASALAGLDTDRLEKVARHDPLVAQALPRETAAEVAPRGSEGAYTLQVVSYETPEHAERFAKTLRARGHKAYVVEAEVPGRGRYHRVRVGPFETRAEANQYQQRFESAERMHTILVSNATK